MIGTERWQQLKKLHGTNLPLPSHIARVPVLLSEDRILISLANCSDLHIFDCKRDNWQTYKWRYNAFEHHVMCLSNDKTKLIIFEGYHRMLVIIDVDTMNIIKTFRQLFRTGICPSIIPDPQSMSTEPLILFLAK